MMLHMGRPQNWESSLALELESEAVGFFAIFVKELRLGRNITAASHN